MHVRHLRAEVIDADAYEIINILSSRFSSLQRMFRDGKEDKSVVRTRNGRTDRFLCLFLLFCVEEWSLISFYFFGCGIVW